MITKGYVEVHVFCGRCSAEMDEEDLVCLGCYNDLKAERDQLKEENKNFQADVNELEKRITFLEEILSNPSDRRSRE